MSLTTAALISGGASLLGGLLGRKGVKDQNVANAKQAQMNRDFQERMSSTSHQRAVTDLRAAGLNPILSATGGGGSSTPSGAMATFKNPMEGAAASAAQLGRLAAETKLLQAQEEKTKQEGNILRPKGTVFGALGDMIENLFSEISGHSAKNQKENKAKPKSFIELPDSKNPTKKYYFENNPFKK